MRDLPALAILALALSFIFPSAAEAQRTLARVEGWATSLAVSGSTLYVTSNTGTITALRLPDGGKLAEYTFPPVDTAYGPVKSQAYYAIPSPDGRWILSAASSGILMALDAALKPVASIPLPEVHSHSAAFTGQDTALVSAISGLVREVKVPSLKTIWEVKANWDPVKAIAVDPGSRYFATASAGSRIHIRDVKDGSLAKTLAGHKDAVFAVDFTPDGKSLLSGSRDGRLLLWDTASGAARLLYQDDLQVQAAVAAPDGRTAAAAIRGKEIGVFRLDTMTLAATLKGHTGAVLALAWRGGALYSAGADGTARAWDLERYLDENKTRKEVR